MATTYKNQLNALHKRVATLESEAEIRRLVGRYMELCDQLGPDTPMDELGALFTEDAVWQGSGATYSKTFGQHQGRRAIVAFLETYRAPRPHFLSNVHFLTSESVRVSGARAEGSWVMLQTPTFANGDSFVLAARLALQFTREHGCWRISRFRTTNLLGRPIRGGWHSKAPIPAPAANATQEDR